MRRFFQTVILISCSLNVTAQIGKVGINTITPAAMLHVKDSSVLFSGSSTPPTGGFGAPASGQGVRMMWLPDRAAFRAGYVNSNNAWNTDSIGLYSFAVGFNTKAKGLYSSALGEASIATGVASFSAGRLAISSGLASSALGEFTEASGTRSFAVGSRTEAIGVNSFAAGEETNASGLNSTTMGFATAASGNSSVALGNSTDANGSNSVAIGFLTRANATNSSSMGHSTEANGINSTAMGEGTRARAYSSLSIGQFNDSIISSSQITWLTTDPVFIIGNGTSNAARSNAFTVLKNAKTGINTEAPMAGLHIKGIDGTENNHIRLEDNNSAEYASFYYTGDLNFRNNRTGGDFFFRDDAGTSVLSLFSSGNMTIAGTLTQNSDARLKKDIVPLQSSLQKILSLNGYQYHWIEPARNPNIQTGVLAQEVEKQMPELITTDNDGMKAVNYSGLVPYLIEAIKTQQQTIELLQSRITKLENNNK